MAKDHRAFQKTVYPGVIYREHATRRHGVKFDQYFVIHYWHDRKTHKEAIGWASHGWTAKKAAGLLGELKENQRRAEPPFTLKEKRQMENDRRAEAKNADVTFEAFFEKTYLPAQSEKTARTIYREKTLFNTWLKTAIGDKTFANIAEIQIEQIKAKMLKAGRSARTIVYALALVRQIWKLAQRKKYTKHSWPGEHIEKPKADNRRMAFFTFEQADQLLEKLNEKSEQWHDLTLLSLQTGLRAGEIFNLTWADVDLDNGTLFIRDTKSSHDRFVFLTERARTIFEKRERGQKSELVFKNRNGGKISEPSNFFQRTVDDLGFNDGVTDRRHKLTYHSCRHTFASWAAMTGTDMFTLQKLLGHETPAMTARYSHMATDGLRAAIKSFEKAIKQPKMDTGKVIEIRPNEARRGPFSGHSKP